MKKQNEYGNQLKLAALSLLGELPNFFALLFSAIGTRAIIMFVDLIDTASNVLRNVFVLLVSNSLKKDLRHKYNYGVGKIEALTSLLCDFVMMISLLVVLGFAVVHIIDPRPAEEFLWFAVCVKVANLLGDGYLYLSQKKINEEADSPVFDSALATAVKNLLFDSASFVVILTMLLFGKVRLFWYLSPVLSLILGIYILILTIKRMAQTVPVVLDRTADPAIQARIQETLNEYFDHYDMIKNVKSRLDGGTTIVDLELSFTPETTYREITDIIHTISVALSEKIPNCEVTLHIAGAREDN